MSLIEPEVVELFAARVRDYVVMPFSQVWCIILQLFLNPNLDSYLYNVLAEFIAQYQLYGMSISETVDQVLKHEKNVKWLFNAAQTSRWFLVNYIEIPEPDALVPSKSPKANQKLWIESSLAFWKIELLTDKKLLARVLERVPAGFHYVCEQLMLMQDYDLALIAFTGKNDSVKGCMMIAPADIRFLLDLLNKIREKLDARHDVLSIFRLISNSHQTKFKALRQVFFNDEATTASLLEDIADYVGVLTGDNLMRHLQAYENIFNLIYLWQRKAAHGSSENIPEDSFLFRAQRLRPFPASGRGVRRRRNAESSRNGRKVRRRFNKLPANVLR